MDTNKLTILMHAIQDGMTLQYPHPTLEGQWDDVLPDRAAKLPLESLQRCRLKPKPSPGFTLGDMVEGLKQRSEEATGRRQVGGNHYAKLTIQPWDAMEEWLSAEEFRGFLKGNVIKYLARNKSHDDLAKAHHYSQKLQEVDHE